MNKKFLIILGIIIFLVVVWFLASPLFIDKTIDEELPVNNNQENSRGENISVGVTPAPLYSGAFMDADSFHKVSGRAEIWVGEGNELFLRLEDFQATNGPDLKVWLSEDTTPDSASEYVSLGELKGNIGNQNYNIPEGTDLEKYNNVLIWCEAFSVLFGNAEIG